MSRFLIKIKHLFFPFEGGFFLLLIHEKEKNLGKGSIDSLNKKLLSSRLQIISQNQNLTVSVTHDNVGTYFCHAEVPGYAPLTSSPAEILMTGKPNISSNPVQRGVVGDNVHLDCVAITIPPAEKIVWKYHGTQIDESKREFIAGHFQQLLYEMPSSPSQINTLLKLNPSTPWLYDTAQNTPCPFIQSNSLSKFSPKK